MISIAQDDNTNLKSIDPIYENQVKQLRQQKSTPAGELSGEPTSSLRALSRPAGSAYENSVSQNSENVNNDNNDITRLVDLGYDDRASAIHEISDIKRTTIDSNEPVRRDNFRKNSGSQSPDR